MVAESKKLSIIQYVLEEKDELFLDSVEKMFHSKIISATTKSLRDLTGRITLEEAEEWERIVEETSEKIFEDDWK